MRATLNNGRNGVGETRHEGGQIMCQWRKNPKLTFRTLREVACSERALFQQIKDDTFNRGSNRLKAVKCEGRAARSVDVQ
jgi:hypothetical protein